MYIKISIDLLTDIEEHFRLTPAKMRTEDNNNMHKKFESNNCRLQNTIVYPFLEFYQTLMKFYKRIYNGVLQPAIVLKMTVCF